MFKSKCEVYHEKRKLFVRMSHNYGLAEMVLLILDKQIATLDEQ